MLPHAQRVMLLNTSQHRCVFQRCIQLVVIVMKLENLDDRGNRVRDLLLFSSRRRHTRYWRDWSSDVCSSDLQAGFPRGEGTFSATPLAWTHAQFVRLAWSIEAKRPVEQPSNVACRYTGRCTN